MAVVYRRQRSLFSDSFKSQFSCWNISPFLRKSKTLPNRDLQNASLKSLALNTGDRFGSLCYFGLGKVRFYSTGRNRIQDLSILAERTSRAASFHIQFPHFRFPSLVIPVNVFNYGSPSGRIRLSSNYPAASVYRPFSTNATTNSNRNPSALATKDSDASRPTNQGKMDLLVESASSSSLLGNANIVQKSSRKKSTRRKNKDKSTDSSTFAKDENGASSPKELNNNKKNLDTVTSEENTRTKHDGKLNGPCLVKHRRSKTKTARSARKVKSEKVSKVDAAPPPVVVEICSELKQESQIVSKSSPQKLKPLYPPTGKSVLIVESVTKAKVIQGYLGEMFEVLPSYGHVRDLASRSGSVRPDDDFSMVWEVPSVAWTHLNSIKVALDCAENLIIASDPDREGEAIAWHIIEMLQQQEALRDEITIARVVFNEITEASIKTALQAPRSIDLNMVHAYLARRALDYLIGFNISPLLWRKLPGCHSAGRVQSAALSLICDREVEIESFKPHEYWTIEVQFKNKKELSSLKSLSSYLTISSEDEAKGIEQNINSSEFEVIGSKINKVKRNPPAPYITSSLQQDAANKLHFTATHTMKLAQKLYEGIQLSDSSATGLITYMKTDGLHISDESANDIRSLVIERYGMEYTPDNTSCRYFNKEKNVREVQEAIRPTNIRRLPSTLVGILDNDSLKLYTLIWARTMACQMEPVTINQLELDIGNIDRSVALGSDCSTVEFPGYQVVYEDIQAKMLNYFDNEGDKEVFKFLCDLKSGDKLCPTKVELCQHNTQPPSRYCEASLVKKLEELRIGRPSTYASTLRVLQDRNYVHVKNKVLYPEFRARMVSAFLSHYFSEVTEYSFTADMEAELDNVSAGLTEWKHLLRDYWTRFNKYCERTANVNIHQVEKMLERTFGDFLASSLSGQSRTCPICLDGTLVFKVSRFGAGYFIGCDQNPKCKYVAKTLYGDEEEEDEDNVDKEFVGEIKLLGLHPVSGEKILLKGGPYGSYVQLGEDRKGSLPKRASVSPASNVNSVTLEDALDFLRYPITLGNHPSDGHPIVLKLGRSGFSLRHRRSILIVPKKINATNITLEKAVKLLRGRYVKEWGRKSPPTTRRSQA
ncbi:DNA topoisomerase 1-like [Impatiens glandulifera]|uniref:DNA topoisomerase 1-like n=1 Tax=Impatiens glandulifera TaxID=253017 RepID=UPI001FB0D5BA|nr:DNA topoisomerase 1-like [Impatiens glandulifera]